MDLLDEARREGLEAWGRGRRLVGPSIGRDEAEAIALASLFEAQDAAPCAPAEELLLRVRNTVLNAMRDERRYLSRNAGRLDDCCEGSETSPESRLDRGIIRHWLRDELAQLAWADQRLLVDWAKASALLPQRVTRGRSRWSVRRALTRVLDDLRARGRRGLGEVELPRHCGDITL